MTLTIIILHALHIVFASVWFGSLLYTELIAWPRLRAAGHLEVVQAALRNVRARQMIGVSVVGTIVTGYARGLAGGALDNLYTPYGLMFVSAAVVGFAMLSWWLSFPPRTLKTPWRMFYTSFWVMLALMVGMHFNPLPSG